MKIRNITIPKEFKPFEDIGELTCTCGKPIFVGTTDIGQAGVIHALPTCELFNRYENPIDYVTALRKIRQGS